MTEMAIEVPRLKSNLFRLFLLSFSGSIIYALPYFRLYYYDAYVATYHLNNVQMGALGSAYGLFGLFSYLIGGVLADRFSAKKLLVFSLVATGVGGFAHLVYPTYATLVAVYGMWGITSLLTFWPALIKAIRMQGNPREQGRVFGLFEGGRGVVNAIHLAVATALFGYLQIKVGDVGGIEGVIVLYSVVTALAGVLIFFTLKETEGEGQGQATRFETKNLIRILRMPSVWMVTLLLCSCYTYNMSFYYFTPYATQVFGTTAVLGAVLTVLAQYCRPVASASAGFLADRFGKANLLILGFLAMAAATLAVVAIPGKAGMVPALVVACVIIYFAMYSNYGLFYALLEEGGVPIEISGMAIGFISTIGYLPEVLCPVIAGKMLDSFPGVSGYHMYFTGMACMAFLGAALAFAWSRTYGRRAQGAR